MPHKTGSYYPLAEGQIWCPSGTVDRSVNVFIHHDPAISLTMNISRDRLEDKETLSSYIVRQLGLLQKGFRQYQLQQHLCFYLGKARLRAEQLEASYPLNQQRVYQIQVATELAAGQIMIFTATHATPFSDLQREVWADWLNSFELNP